MAGGARAAGGGGAGAADPVMAGGARAAGEARQDDHVVRQRPIGAVAQRLSVAALLRGAQQCVLERKHGRAVFSDGGHLSQAASRSWVWPSRRSATTSLSTTPSVSAPAVAGTTALAPACSASASQPASGRAARTTT